MEKNNNSKTKKISKNLNLAEYSEEEAKKAQSIITKIKNEEIKKIEQKEEESPDQKNKETDQE